MSSAIPGLLDISCTCGSLRVTETTSLARHLATLPIIRCTSSGSLLQCFLYNLATKAPEKVCAHRGGLGTSDRRIKIRLEFSGRRQYLFWESHENSQPSRTAFSNIRSGFLMDRRIFRDYWMLHLYHRNRRRRRVWVHSIKRCELHHAPPKPQLLCLNDRMHRVEHC